jgi:hypothetical protein
LTNKENGQEVEETKAAICEEIAALEARLSALEADTNNPYSVPSNAFRSLSFI